VVNKPVRTLLSTILSLLWLCFGILSSIQAQNLKEYSEVDSLKVGDTFDYAITLDRDQEYDSIVFPDSSEFGELFEIRSRKQFKVSSFKDSVAYTLQFFGTTDTTLPSLPVYLVQDRDTTTLYTNPIPVGFHSILAKDEQEFRPLKPIFDFAAAWWPYILGLLLLGAAGYYLYQYFIKKQQQEEPEPKKQFSPTPFVNPLHQFRETIEDLEDAKLNSREDFKKFYIKLGDAIRRYYESLYSLPALESTSRELLQMLQRGAIDEDLLKDTRAVLQEADMVKFAKFTPTQEQANRALRKAYNFLDRAKSVDGPRIEHLRRQHQASVEANRQRFNEEQEAEEVQS